MKRKWNDIDPQIIFPFMCLASAILVSMFFLEIKLILM